MSGWNSVMLEQRHEDGCSAANVDVFLEPPDGSNWALTIFTVDEIGRLLARWKQTGEVANGGYFRAVGQLIVPEPGVAAMTKAIRDLPAAGEMENVRARCADPRLTLLRVETGQRAADGSFTGRGVTGSVSS